MKAVRWKAGSPKNKLSANVASAFTGALDAMKSVVQTAPFVFHLRLKFAPTRTPHHALPCTVYTLDETPGIVDNNTLLTLPKMKPIHIATKRLSFAIRRHFIANRGFQEDFKITTVATDMEEEPLFDLVERVRSQTIEIPDAVQAIYSMINRQQVNAAQLSPSHTTRVSTSREV